MTETMLKKKRNEILKKYDKHTQADILRIIELTRKIWFMEFEEKK